MQVYNVGLSTLTQRATFLEYEASFRQRARRRPRRGAAFPVGVRIALGVLQGGPGASEIVVGNGPGGHPRVRVVFWPPAGPVQRLEILPLEIP